MAAPNIRFLARLPKLLEGVLPNRLEHREARLLIGPLQSDEALVDQRCQPVEYVEVASANSLGRLERPAAGEDGEAGEEPAARLAQEVVAPVERRAQCLMSCRPIARPSGQDPRRCVQPREQRSRREQRRARRRARSRAASRPGAQIAATACALASVSCEVGSDRLRALDEQAHSLVGDDRVPAPPAIGQLERRHREDPLARDVERLATRRQDLESGCGGGRASPPQARPRRHARRCRARGGACAREVLRQDLERAPAWHAQAQYMRDRRDDELGVRDRSERHEPGPGGEPSEAVGGRLEREPRLPGSARTGQREDRELVAREPVAHLAELALPADQRRPLHRQVRRPCVEGVEWRELVVEALRDELEDPFGLRQVPEAVWSEVAQRDVLERLLREQLTCRMRYEDLASVAGGADAGGAVDAQPDISPPLVGRASHVWIPFEPARLPAVGPGMGRERTLRFEGSHDSVPRRGERDEERVALGIHLVPVVGANARRRRRRCAASASA